ncbi:DUF2946 domain-containing protein [Bradyrhizobium sp. B097]|uniref:DUF2946 domain-containing protein n=1 Tax=Bradyrhizobium sp. B097 TaxID=3140244 RepID=UPI003182D962
MSSFSATIVQISSNLRNDWDDATGSCESELKTRDGVRGYKGRWSGRDASVTSGNFRLPEETSEVDDLDFRRLWWLVPSRMGFAMRRRLKIFLPIVLVALLVQIFAPIGACWAASLALSDPLAAATICHGNAGSGAGHGDQTGHDAHDGCCSACSVLQTGAPIDNPEITAQAVERPSTRIAWLDFAPGLTGSRPISRAQARAPPFLS